MHLPADVPTGGRRARTLAALLTVALALGTLAASPVLATARGDGLRNAANEARADVEVAPVEGTSLLDSIADVRADQMRDADKLEHNMEYVKSRLVKSGVCWTGFGEIIAWRSGGPYSYQATITQWLNSKPHREIMLDPGYNAAGGSWATATDGGHYSVMIFARLCTSELQQVSTLKPKHEYSPDRPMRFVRGKHTAFKLSSDGRVLDKKHADFAQRTDAESTGRTRVDGTAYLKVSSGQLAGWWVRESPRQFVRGMTQKKTYVSQRTVRIEDGTYTGYLFDNLGRVTDSRRSTISRDRRADVSARAIINGRTWFKVESGRWAGYWLRDNADVDLVG